MLKIPFLSTSLTLFYPQPTLITTKINKEVELYATCVKVLANFYDYLY